MSDASRRIPDDVALLEPPETGRESPIAGAMVSDGSLPAAWPPPPPAQERALAEAGSEPRAGGSGAPLEPRSVGIVPGDLLDIFFRPSRFFSSRIAAGSTPYLVVVAWCYGISDAMDRIDRMLLQSEMGSPRPGWEAVGPLVTRSWGAYWVFCLAVGALSGAMLYMLGGWWYRVRLKWAGDPDPDPSMARRVYIYSAFVMAAPMILSAAAQTLAFPDYGAAWGSAELYTLALVVFPFWSIAASYSGARAVFRVGAWRSRIWFLILPAAAYLFAFGAIAAAVALLGA